MCMCARTRVRVYICMYAGAHVYLCGACTHMCVCMHVCMCTCIGLCAHMWGGACVHVCPRVLGGVSKPHGEVGQ